MKTFILLCLLTASISSFIGAESGKMPFDATLEKVFAGDKALRRNESTVQTFYAYRPKNGKEAILVYWPEARYLLSLDNYDFEDPAWLKENQAVQYIDLEKEVTSNEEGAAGNLQAYLAVNVLADIRRCLDGRRVVIDTPPDSIMGPFDATVVQLKPQALKYSKGQLDYVYDLVELRVDSKGPLAGHIISVAIPTKGTMFYQKIAKSGVMRLRIESWAELATPGRRLRVMGDMKEYLKAKQENAPFAIFYASASDVDPL